MNNKHLYPLVKTEFYSKFNNGMFLNHDQLKEFEINYLQNKGEQDDDSSGRESRSQGD